MVIFMRSDEQDYMSYVVTLTGMSSINVAMVDEADDQKKLASKFIGTI